MIYDKTGLLLLLLNAGIIAIRYAKTKQINRIYNANKTLTAVQIIQPC